LAIKCLQLYYLMIMRNIQLALFSLFGSTLLSGICTGAPQSRRCTHISIYEHENYRGRTLAISLGSQCKDFRGPFRNAISSVQLNSKCVQLCRQENCGQCTEIRESFVDLVVINFNDQIRSIKQCNEFYLDYQIGPSDVQVGVTHWRAQGPIPVAPEVEPNESK
ncbi:unnamed protein product, partial [Allacma fusca]